MLRGAGDAAFAAGADIAEFASELADAKQAAGYVCEGCGVMIEERHKTEMLAGGEWRPTAPGDGITRGYHLSALYSPAAPLTVSGVDVWLRQPVSVSTGRIEEGSYVVSCSAPYVAHTF